MSQMSAGSRTDVGAYHRDDNEATEKHLGDLSGQFSLMDHRTASEVRARAHMPRLPAWNLFGGMVTSCPRKVLAKRSAASAFCRVAFHLQNPSCPSAADATDVLSS